MAGRFLFGRLIRVSISIRSCGNMAANVEWKGAVEKLLIRERGVSTDGLVFTRQKYATVFCKAYRQAQAKEERRNILTHLISQYGRSNVKNVSLSSEMDDKWYMDITRLLKDTPPPYHQLFRAVGQLEDGIKFLVDLRADVLAWLRDATLPSATPQSDEISVSALKLMDTILQDLLSIWFSIGLLDVERVTWKSPCDLLQRVAEYESVHPVRSWTDLKNRVGPRRRCFVFTHPSVPGEPIVVLHVALMDRIPEKISDVISHQLSNQKNWTTSTPPEESLENVNAAIFYSINSTQPGLKGIDLGHFLIKRVIQQLSAELPSLNAFSSLSPIPGFRKWLTEELRRNQKGRENQQLPVETREFPLLNALMEKNEWYGHSELREQLRPILLRLCAFYLLRVKRRGSVYDPVANFHLRNGAVLWRLNWDGDTSPHALNQSCSLMVNYRYYLNQTDENSRSYLDDKRVIAHDQVRNLLDNWTRSYL